MPDKKDSGEEIRSDSINNDSEVSNNESLKKRNKNYEFGIPEAESVNNSDNLDNRIPDGNLNSDSSTGNGIDPNTYKNNNAGTEDLPFIERSEKRDINEGFAVEVTEEDEEESEKINLIEEEKPTEIHRKVSIVDIIDTVSEKVENEELENEDNDIYDEVKEKIKEEIKEEKIIEKLDAELKDNENSIQDDEFVEDENEEEIILKDEIEDEIEDEIVQEPEAMEQEFEDFSFEKLQEQKIKEYKAIQERFNKQMFNEQNTNNGTEKQEFEEQRIRKEELERQKLEEQRIKEEELERQMLEEQRIKEEELERQRLEEQRIEEEELERQRLEEQRIKEEELERQRLEEQRIKEELERQRLEEQRIKEEEIQKQKLEEEINKKSEGVTLGDLLKSNEVIKMDSNNKIYLNEMKKTHEENMKFQNVQKEQKKEYKDSEIEEVNHREKIEKSKDIENNENIKSKDESIPDTFEELIAESPGWKPKIKKEEKSDIITIVEAVEGYYNDRKPLKYELLNEEDKETTDFDVVDGIYVYERNKPIAHWHFVTIKLSDLYERLWDGPKLSGVGFELSFRLKRKGEQKPPNWAIEFVQALAGYAYSSGNFMANGHCIAMNGIAEFPDNSYLDSIAVVYDPDLKPINTQKGKREFLQVFGITEKEQIAMQSWDSIKVIKLFSDKMPKFITVQNRKCLMDSPQVSNVVAKGIEKDGSKTGVLFSEKVTFKRKKVFFIFDEFLINIDRFTIESLISVIRGRIPKGKELIVVGDGCKVIIKPNPVSEVRIKEDQIDIDIDHKSYFDLIDKCNMELGKFKVKGIKGIKFVVV